MARLNYTDLLYLAKSAEQKGHYPEAIEHLTRAKKTREYQQDEEERVQLDIWLKRLEKLK